jgi:hypothetical protein
MIRLLGDLIRWLWWSWIASKWSGGGPRHPSYAAARLNKWVYGGRLKGWLQGAYDYE